MEKGKRQKDFAEPIDFLGISAIMEEEKTEMIHKGVLL